MEAAALTAATCFKNSAFMFYDEKKNLVRVTVAQCLDYTKMGYEYEYSDLPWLHSRPAQKPVPANIMKLAKGLPTAEKVFPLKPVKTVKFQGRRTRCWCWRISSRITPSPSRLTCSSTMKPDELDRAEYVGSFTHLPHRVKGKESVNNLRLNLREVYENINIADDDAVVITIVPQFNGDAVTIGGIKIVRRSDK